MCVYMYIYIYICMEYHHLETWVTDGDTRASRNQENRWKSLAAPKMLTRMAMAIGWYFEGSDGRYYRTWMMTIYYHIIV